MVPISASDIPSPHAVTWGGDENKRKFPVPCQGCRFGPESSRQTLVSPIFRSLGTICGGFVSENAQGTNLQPSMSITFFYPCRSQCPSVASQALRTLKWIPSHNSHFKMGWFLGSKKGWSRANRAQPTHLILSFSAFCLEIWDHTLDGRNPKQPPEM